MSRTHHHGDRKKQAMFNPWLWLQSTPGWWVRMMMTKPQRRIASMWQRNAEKLPPDALESAGQPPHGRKPHIYFW